MFHKNFLSFICKKRMSYSQSAEDLIVQRVFSRIGIKQPTYLDIGANDPVLTNNTYHFYNIGSRGVLVEPDPDLAKLIKKKRKGDILLNAGIGVNSEKTSDFYIMSVNTLNTLSAEEANKLQAGGKIKIIKTITIPLLDINDIIEKYFSPCPNFISLDAESVDFEILKKINFVKYRPEVFCIETLTFTQDNAEKKRDEIFRFMDEMGYLNFADTYINTIFVDRKKWINR
jgi:FkbM family methyltransferase